MVAKLKKQFYDILSSLKYEVTDNNYDMIQTFPFVRLTLYDVKRIMYKNAYNYTIKFKIDIFSDYDGESEILNMEENIFEHSSVLYDNDFVTYVQQSSFRITDDKSTGVVRKHGIIIYTITCNGGIVNE